MTAKTPDPVAHAIADCVRVRGARGHNLKDVDVDIPRDALVVFTGVSGSGKSSLAFGTLFAEAQRRYLDSISPYARRLIDQAATRLAAGGRDSALAGRLERLASGLRVTGQDAAAGRRVTALNETLRGIARRLR